jgi:flagellar motor switch protein FliM
MTLKDTIKNIHKSKISFYNIKRNNRLFLDLLKIGILIHSPFKRHTHHFINKEDLILK